MRKLYIVAFALAAVLPASAENKFDARSEILVGQYKQFVKDPSQILIDAGQLPFHADMISRSEAVASVSVVLADNATREDIEALGFAVNAATQRVLLIEGSMDDIIALAETDLVKSVSFAYDIDAQLDCARQQTGVKTIHSGGDGLPRAYTGKGVITAIYDTGFYPDHYNFKDADAKCRISNFWHVTANDGSKVTHYDTPEKVAIKDWTDNTGSSHGSHTLGCMAGYCHKNVSSMIRYDQQTGEWETVNRLTDRNGKPVPFYGMATESEIIASSGALTNQAMMVGLQKMSDYIKASGKPGVINISIGTVIGPRDGTDEFTAFLDDIAKDVPVCISAGNDGDARMSLSGSSYKSFLSPDDGSVASFAGAIDIWSENDKPFSVTPVIYDLTAREIVYSYTVNNADKSQIIIGTSNYSNVDVTDKQIDRAFSASSLIIKPKILQTNNRYNVYMQYNITYNKTTNSDHRLVFGLMVEGVNGQRIDLSNRSTEGNAMLSSLEQIGWTDGSADLSINSMACGYNTIAVGAWNTRNEWGITTHGKSKIYYSSDPASVGFGLGDVAGYSSYGLLADGRRKPDLCAPGTGIISSVSTPGEKSLDNLTYPCATYSVGTRRDMWGLMQGTSMSSPVVAGAIALWLEADPDLTPSEIRNIAMNSCDTDDYTSSGNTLRWGAGKFNALKGLKQILGMAGIDDITADAGSKVQVTPVGERMWTINAFGSESVVATLYALSGQVVAQTKAQGDEATLDALNVEPGIYILNVNGIHNTKLILK